MNHFLRMNLSFLMFLRNLNYHLCLKYRLILMNQKYLNYRLNLILLKNLSCH